MPKCWICGKPATRTHLTGKYVFGKLITEIEEGERAYCDECYNVHTDEVERLRLECLEVKKLLMHERACRLMEKQKLDMYYYKSLLDDMYSMVQSDPTLFDSAEEMIAAVILADNEISFKHHHRIGRYETDFYIESLSVILEIDGDRHGLTLAKDNDRDIYLRTELGKSWEVIRIGANYIDQNAELLVEAIKTMKKEKQKIREENCGIIPSWYSKRSKSKVKYGSRGDEWIDCEDLDV